MPRRVTQPGTRRLSEVARHLSLPEGIVSTGYPDVARTCTKMGVAFDGWQVGACQVILGKREDGLLATTVGGVGMSLPRQVGKTYMIAGLVFALCINNPGMLIIWTAHHLKTSGETFLAMQAFAERSKVAPFVRKVYTGSGDEEVRFHNGSRILFGARERGFGRGIPGVDALVFDEAQILSDRALDAMLATMNTSSFGMHLYIGTPPRPDDSSESFTRMRSEALSEAPDPDTAWIECGADKGSSPSDRKQWAKANPSYPHRTPVQAFQRLQKKLTPEGFLREGLGIWDEASNKVEVFGPGAWEALAQPAPAGMPMRALGVAVAVDLRKSALVAVGEADGVAHAKPLHHEGGTAWVVDRVRDLVRKHEVPVVIDGKGPGAVLVPELERAVGSWLVVASTENVLDACAGIEQSVTDRTLAHEAFPELDDAVVAAVKRDVRDRWAWGRRKSEGDITPLEALTLALWGMHKRARIRSAYADDEADLVVI